MGSPGDQRRRRGDDDPAVYTRSGYAKSRYVRRFGATWNRSAAVTTERRRVSRHPPRSGTGSRLLIALVLVPLLAIGLIGGSLGLAATATVAVLSQNLPDPSTL